MMEFHPFCITVSAPACILNPAVGRANVKLLVVSCQDDFQEKSALMMASKAVHLKGDDSEVGEGGGAGTSFVIRMHFYTPL